MGEERQWPCAERMGAGDVLDSGHQATVGGNADSRKQQVRAKVDYVMGEFYWKVEIGETVEATEFAGPGGKLSRERTPTEVNYSFVTPVVPHEVAAFGVAPPAGGGGGLGGFGEGGDGGGSGAGTILIAIVVIVVICLILAMAMGGACGGGGGSYSGGGWSK